MVGSVNTPETASTIYYAESSLSSSETIEDLKNKQLLKKQKNKSNIEQQLTAARKVSCSTRPSKYYRNRAQSNPSEAKTKEFTLAVLGASRVGKSALVGQFLWDGFVKEYRPTIEEFNWIEYNNEHEKEFMLQVIDSSGSHDFLAMRQLYARTADAFVVVYAVDDQISFDEAKGILREIQELNLKNAPILLLANKIDLYDSETDWKCQGGEEYASKNNLLFAQISAKNSQKVDEVFAIILSKIGFLSEQLKKRRQSMPSTRAYSGLDAVTIAKVAKKHEKSGCIVS